MNIFRRTADMISANLNGLIDRFEDPERMLRHALREMEDLLPTTTSAVARSIATERLLEKTRNDHSARASAWERKAVSAIDIGNESLARRALERKLDHQRAAAVMDQQLADAHEANEMLRTQLSLLRDKHAAARTKVMLLCAQQSAADAQRQILTSSRTPTTHASAFARFDRLHQQIEFAQAEATAALELEAGNDLEIDSQIDEQSIDEELARLKASRQPAAV